MIGELKMPRVVRGIGERRKEKEERERREERDSDDEV